MGQTWTVPGLSSANTSNTVLQNTRQLAHTQRSLSLLNKGYGLSSSEVLQCHRQGHFHSPSKIPLSYPGSQAALGWSFLSGPQKPFLPGGGWWGVSSPHTVPHIVPHIVPVPGNEAAHGGGPVLGPGQHELGGDVHSMTDRHTAGSFSAGTSQYFKVITSGFFFFFCFFFHQK